jgi:NAD(P)H dehydrogenase (quinone)
MTVLALGATGNIGPHVLASLIHRGVPTRALVRDPANVGPRIRDQIEVVASDIKQIDSVATHLNGIESLFLFTPHGPDMATTQQNLVRLSARHGIKIVKISGTSSAIRPDGPDACRQHWQVEQDIKNSDAESDGKGLRDPMVSARRVLGLRSVSST